MFAFVAQFSLSKIKNANDRDNSIVGVLFFDALCMYENFSCLCVNLNEGFAFRTADLRLPLQIHKPSIALRTPHLFQCQHIITPSVSQEQYSTYIRNVASAVICLPYKFYCHAHRTLDKSFHHRRQPIVPPQPPYP